MCNCKTEIINKHMSKIKEMYPDVDTVTIKEVEILSGRTYSNLIIKMHDNKKPKEISMLHSYCPHCGKKYIEE